MNKLIYNLPDINKLIKYRKYPIYNKNYIIMFYNLNKFILFNI